MSAVVKHNYNPRSYFKDFHSRKQRFACLIVHRQAGKTHAVIHDMVIRALRTRKSDWCGAYIAPVLKQAKKAAWRKLLNAVSNIPGVKNSKSELSVTFPNGATIYLTGADNMESIRGVSLDFACIDEYGDMHPSLLGMIVLPALSARAGSLVIIGTPKGQNHFYTRAMKAKARPKTWFYQHLAITDTKDEALSYARQQILKEEELDEAEWNQEYLCSFTAEFRGSYYAKALDELSRKPNGGFGIFKHVIGVPVEVAMDVGHRDATAIWFMQYVGGRARVIEYFERLGMDAKETADELYLRPYTYGAVWVPHDAFHKTWTSSKSGFDTLLQAGLPVRRVPNPDAGNRVYHGIDAVRKVLRTWDIDIDNEKCAQGILALRNYSRKYDIKRQSFVDTPNHDQWSHGADAFRYLCLSLNSSALARSRELRIVEGPGNRLINKPIAFNGPTYQELLDRHDAIVADREANYFRIRN